MTARLNAAAIARLRNVAEAERAIGSPQTATDLELLLEWHGRETAPAAAISEVAAAQIMASMREQEINLLAAILMNSPARTAYRAGVSFPQDPQACLEVATVIFDRYVGLVMAFLRSDQKRSA